MTTGCKHNFPISRFICILFFVVNFLCTYVVFFLKKMGQPLPLFRLYLVFSNKQYNFYIKLM